MAATGTPAFSATRRALHAVAEHVLLADLYDHSGRIGLHPLPGGFGTPTYRTGDGSHRRLRVEGTDVVDERDGQAVDRVPLREPITLGDLRASLGVTASAPADVYDLGSDGSPAQAVAVDRASAALIASLVAVANQALTALGDEARADPGRSSGDGIGTIHLWPERLDLARSIDEVAYGASPGDEDRPEPYLYVVPWTPPAAGEPWNEPFGATRSARPVPSVAEALAWWRQIRATITSRPGSP